MKNFLKPAVLSLSRRHFVKGVASSGAALASTGLFSSSAIANATDAPVLSGNTFHLEVDYLPVNITGKATEAYSINGSTPAPTLIWREGETVTIRVTNRLPVPTSIHWHGMILPYQMDGVPGISFAGIAPGQTFTYQFKVKQSGTYWYHSHSGFQEMKGMFGAIIIVPAEGERIKADREFVVQLSDWTDELPMSVLSKLKHESHYYNLNKPTALNLAADIKQNGLVAAASRRHMWNQMRMSPTDLADVSALGFTYLMNGATALQNWTGIFKPRERIRLRFINAAGNTFYDVRIPGLPLTIVQADGQDVEPVTVDEFRFGPGETYDAVIEPQDDAYTIFAQTMDRTGYVRGTLAVASGLTAPVPKVEEVEWLAMRDMMGEMDHGNHGDHSQHGKMALDHSEHQSLATPSQTVRHASTEFGPSVDMRVDMPRTNLDDPGVGLRNNGRRVLTAADLHTLGGPLDTRMPERELELHLTGNMERYSWSFDGLEFGKSTPVHLRFGERVRIILQNDTMMTHPMHMHGVWSELENDAGEFMARRHTIAVQPAQRISYLVTADALGRWAWHCHLMFHMDAGMFREVVIA